MKGAKQLMKRMSAREAAMFYLLHREQDVLIDKLYRHVWSSIRDPRKQQQIVGSVISRINRKIADTGYRVTPGDLRRTYRLRRSA